jgi:hypothetical protein
LAAAAPTALLAAVAPRLLSCDANASDSSATQARPLAGSPAPPTNIVVRAPRSWCYKRGVCQNSNCLGWKYRCGNTSNLLSGLIFIILPGN